MMWEAVVIDVSAICEQVSMLSTYARMCVDAKAGTLAYKYICVP
jgi:hypothetical protein